MFRGTNTRRRASDSWPVFTKPGCTPCGNIYSPLSGDMITWRFLWETIQASGWNRSSKCFCSRKRIRGVSYLHCSSLLGSQWWCNGKTGCHRSHPPGALQANTTFNYLHNRAGSLIHVQVTLNSPFSVSVTWCSISSYFASSWNNNGMMSFVVRHSTPDAVSFLFSP